MADVKYFNAPISLYAGFMHNSNSCLNDVFDYAIYQHSLKLTGTQPVRFKAACEWYEVTSGSSSKSIANGKELNETIPAKSPKTGLSLSLFWEFYGSDKSDFEKICLLAHLALKSILKDKPYFKLTNSYWLARMDGKSSSVKSLYELSEEIQKYSTEYQLTKIKKELRDNWGLSYYGKNVRGFYVSNSLTIEQLVLEVFKSRQKKTDNYAERIKEAEKQALENISRP
jgi:hypothetical protein